MPFSLATILLICVTSGVVNQVSAHYPSAVINSSGASITPTIDGEFSAGEWDDATFVPLVDAYTIYGYFKNDWDFLYILIDVPTYMVQYSFLSMSFDTGHDEIYTANHDDDFLINPDGTTRHSVANGTITPGPGIDFWADYHEHCSPFDHLFLHHNGLEGATGFSTSPNEAVDHRIYEISIPLDLLGMNAASPGNTIGFALSGVGRDGMGGWQWPVHQSNAGSRPLGDYGNIELAYFATLAGWPFDLLGNFHFHLLANPPVINVQVKGYENIDLDSLQISYGSPIDVSGQLVDPTREGRLLLEVKTEDEPLFYQITIQAHPRADNWPMFRHDPGNKAFSSSPAPSTNRTEWVSNMSDRPWGTPAVENCKVYIAARQGMISALDAFNGSIIWQYQTVGQAPGSPAVSNGTVYVGSSNMTSLDYKVYALNASTGAHIWNYTTGGPIASSPTFANGNIYVGSNNGLLYALQDSGSILWTYNTGAAIGLSSPAVSGSRVFIGNLGGKVFALNAKNGAHIWNYTTGGGITTSPAMVNGRVYVGSEDNNVYCLNASNGISIWNYTTDDAVSFSNPAVAYDKVYLGSMDNNIYALDALNGNRIWNYTTEGGIISSPAVAEGKVYLGTSAEDDTIYSFNASTGELLWSYITGLATHRSNPAVAYGNVYISTYNQKVYCFGPEHDVAILNVQLSKNVVGQGYPVSINITLRNNGDVTELIHIEAYAIGIPSTLLPITVPSGGLAVLIIDWDTADADKGNYTITATALPVPGELHTGDNTLPATMEVIVTIPGDVDGDRDVDIYDIVAMAGAYGSKEGEPEYIANCDIDGDGDIDIFDIVAAAGNYGESW